ncbi:hypothetical protein N7510_003238 [Penicillium lagena]|uniref:uncharacterized protein n=1 Tax=Penicillium lagena TaxID=94218 RepID=UPI0025417585|nr:uncharacterized protein N7510_003238 [Penicillium lagena]KAJ5619254.1 hypothetical protein N7510_003238 [Penicillium lagena]
MANPFRSARLIYRAVEPTEDEAFILTMQQDPVSFSNSNAMIAKPQSKKDALKCIQSLEEALLGVVICLPPTEAHGKPIPIGAISLKPVPVPMMHHRSTEIGIGIVQAYQGQGYGSEAINWILEWAFETAGMHRVSVRHFEYNEGAGRLYKRLGFKVEGVIREELWHKGRWWNGVQMGMLSQEWTELQQKRETHN